MQTITFFLLATVGIIVINGLSSTDDNNNLEENQPAHRTLAECYAWYIIQPNPKILLAQTAEPPCSISTPFPSTLPGGWETDETCDASKQPNTCEYHRGAYGCYRNCLRKTGPSAQACYDRNGQWISDPWKGAGTVDRQTPCGDLIQQALHVAADVAPYYSCCLLSLFPKYPCSLYYEKRPPGTCKNTIAG